MKKNHFRKILFPCLFLFVLFTSCEKSSADATISLKQLGNVKSLKQVPEVENMVLANFKDKDVIDLIEKLKSTKLNQPITSKNIYKVTFKDLPTLKGFFIKGEETEQVIEDIFYVFEIGSRLNLFINREKTGFVNKNNNKGYISIRDINNNLLSNDYVEENRYVLNANLTKITLSNNSNVKPSFLEWDCTRDQFNKFYQEAKKECEEDWICDVACSVNPCFISYLAFAVGKCSGLIE
jgi:hypothetical protein